MDFAIFIQRGTAVRCADRIAAAQRVTVTVQRHIVRSEMQGYILRVDGLALTNDQVDNYL